MMMSSMPSPLTSPAALSDRPLTSFTSMPLMTDPLVPSSDASEMLVNGEEAELAVTVRPVSWAGVSVQDPSPLSVPAERDAPAGTPAMVIDRLSEPSRSVSAALMSSGIATPTPPAVSCVPTEGASATPSTVTVTVADAVSPTGSATV